VNMRTGFALLAIPVVCILSNSCQNPVTTWSAEARSPDGYWLATARSQQWSGPGNAYDATSVYLKRTNASEDPIEILGFSHQYATMNLKMEWVTPRHLEVTYGASINPGDQVDLYFQAVKCAGIEISVRELSRETTNIPP
jgi:hypothetical protein